MNDRAEKLLAQEETATTMKKTCGIIMPISNQPGCSAEHWSEVRSIIEEAISGIEGAAFEARLVSDADDVGVIQKRIVQNVYSSDIVVCDVSCKNANVMFELGMRLAFDKPTVIIKDDQTDYSFDTGIIEHLTYPRDLRFAKINAFKKSLADKVLATYNASLGPDHSTFLKNFGTFHVASLAQDEVTPAHVVLDMLSEIQLELSRLRRTNRSPTPSHGTINAARYGIRPDDEISSAMYRAIGEYLKSKKLKKAISLIEDSEFPGWIQTQIPLRELYDSNEEFRKALLSHLEFYDLLN